MRERRRTIELKRRIRESAARGAASPRIRRVLIVEPGPPCWPERVFRDPVLKPVDKIVWMVLRQNAVRGRFPSYGQIGRAARVSSKSTVSRSITILRATRWLARCVVRATHGRRPRPGSQRWTTHRRVRAARGPVARVRHPAPGRQLSRIPEIRPGAPTRARP